MVLKQLYLCDNCIQIYNKKELLKYNKLWTFLEKYRIINFNCKNFDDYHNINLTAYVLNFAVAFENYKQRI